MLCGGIHPASLIELDGSTPDSTVLCELTRRFYPILSPSCVNGESRPGKGFGVYPDRGYSRLVYATYEAVWVKGGP